VTDYKVAYCIRLSILLTWRDTVAVELVFLGGLFTLGQRFCFTLGSTAATAWQGSTERIM